MSVAQGGAGGSGAGTEPSFGGPSGGGPGAPRRGGAAMALDAAPHPISMLQTLLGRGDIENVEAKYSRADGDALCLTFSYRHSAGVTTARCHFTVCEEPPRPASYSLNGRWVHRTVELPEYQLYLTRPGSPRSDRSGVQSESEEKATALANNCDDLNKQRKDITKSIFSEVLQIIESEPTTIPSFILIII